MFFFFWMDHECPRKKKKKKNASHIFSYIFELLRFLISGPHLCDLLQKVQRGGGVPEGDAGEGDPKRLRQRDT